MVGSNSKQKVSLSVLFPLWFVQAVFTLSRKISLAEKETPLNLSKLNLKAFHKKFMPSSALKERVLISRLNQVEKT